MAAILVVQTAGISGAQSSQIEPVLSKRLDTLGRHHA